MVPGGVGFGSGDTATGDAALVADVFARGFADRPLFCDLIAHTPLNLERNVSPEAVRRYKLAGSLWQIANPAPAVAELYASDPALAQACVDLAPRLRRTAEILLAGLIPSRSPA